MPKPSEFLFGSKDKIKKAGTLTPEQQELIALINEGLTKGTGAFGGLFGDFDQKGFEEGVTKPALQNFQENILPQIQEKFIAGNQVLGSGMRRGQLKAGTDLQTQLAQLLYNAKQEQQKNKLAGIQNVLGTKGIENIYKQGTTGAVQGFIQGAGQGLGQAAGTAIAG
ncbi:MAG: hypothetical protein KGL39_56935 [Patescibacteria group bacterium]|nr:hypothetical protein [Patescibacteria group bacterium]